MSNSMTPVRLVRGMSQLLCIVLLLLVCSTLSAQNQEPRRVRNIVLVHSAWADGSSWKSVYDVLVKIAYNSASFKSRRRPCKKTSPRRSVSLITRWTVHSCRSQL